MCLHSQAGEGTELVSGGNLIGSEPSSNPGLSKLLLSRNCLGHSEKHLHQDKTFDFKINI